MSGAPRTAAQALAGLLALLPEGRAWSREPGTTLGLVLAGPAGELARLEASALALLAEVDPRAAEALLEDYERVLGPDPCGRDASLLSVEDRQRLAFQRWTARGGQSPATYVALAAALGETITIEETVVPRCGAAVCGDVLTPASEAFTWIVHLADTVVTDAICGAARCGDRLGAFVASAVECVIRHAAPAHTTPVFAYEVA